MLFVSAVLSCRPIILLPSSFCKNALPLMRYSSYPKSQSSCKSVDDSHFTPSGRGYFVAITNSVSIVFENDATAQVELTASLFYLLEVGDDVLYRSLTAIVETSVKNAILSERTKQPEHQNHYL
jgi:hypothetical protein